MFFKTVIALSITLSSIVFCAEKEVKQIEYKIPYLWEIQTRDLVWKQCLLISGRLIDIRLALRVLQETYPDEELLCEIEHNVGVIERIMGYEDRLVK